MLTIAVINQKGGVGKTTTTLNLAHALALRELQVTAIDLDPQAHLSASFGVYEPSQGGIDRALLGLEKLTRLLIPIRERIQLVAAGNRLGEIEHTSCIAPTRLQAVLENQFIEQSCVLIDCPPSSGLLVANALLAADAAIVPVVGDYLALQGLSYLMQTLHRFEATVNKRVPIWIVVTRYQQRRRLAREVIDKLIKYFPGRILATPIRENVALAESPSFGQTIFEYKPNSPGAEDYHLLAEDLLQQRTLS